VWCTCTVEGSSDTCSTLHDRALVLGETHQSPRVLHTDEVPRVVPFTETECRVVVAGLREGRMGHCSIGLVPIVLGEKSSGDGTTTV
jgi:hypothetical protein